MLGFLDPWLELLPRRRRLASALLRGCLLSRWNLFVSSADSRQGETAAGPHIVSAGKQRASWTLVKQNRPFKQASKSHVFSDPLTCVILTLNKTLWFLKIKSENECIRSRKKWSRQRADLNSSNTLAFKWAKYLHTCVSENNGEQLAQNDVSTNLSVCLSVHVVGLK